MPDIFDQIHLKNENQSFGKPKNLSGDIFDSLSSNQETIGENVTRQGIRSFARSAETIVGLPSDLIDLLKTGLGYAAEKISGKELPLFREALEKGPSSIKGDEFIPEQPGSSQQIKSALAEATKGYTEPKSEAEQIADELISDFTALAIPVKGKIPFLRALGTAIGSNLAKQGVKTVGASEKTQEATKLGTMFLAGFMGKPTADTFVSNLYQKAKKSYPEGTMLDSTNILKNIKPVEQELQKGISTSTKKQVLSNVKQLKNKAAGGAVPLDDIIQSYHDINEVMSSKNLFQDLSKSEQRLLRKRYDSLKNVLNSAVQDYGKYNPEFLKNWRDANAGYSAIQQSKKVSKAIQKAANLKTSLITSPALAIFEFYNPQAILPTAVALGTGYGVVKGTELLTRFAKSPVLRKHYINVINEASKENIPAVVKQLEKINLELKKDQP